MKASVECCGINDAKVHNTQASFIRRKSAFAEWCSTTTSCQRVTTCHRLIDSIFWLWWMHAATTMPTRLKTRFYDFICEISTDIWTTIFLEDLEQSQTIVPFNITYIEPKERIDIVARRKAFRLSQFVPSLCTQFIWYFPQIRSIECLRCELIPGSLACDTYSHGWHIWYGQSSENSFH